MVHSDLSGFIIEKTKKKKKKRGGKGMISIVKKKGKRMYCPQNE